MSTMAVIAGIETEVKVGQKVVKGYQKANKVGRKYLAKQEIENGKDLDGNGRIGSVGGKHRRKR